MEKQTDTIVAIATPRGIGALAIVRLSGSEAIQIANKVFRGSKKLSLLNSHRAILGKIVDPSDVEDKLIDEVIITVYKCPKSYTGENVVEISCHGGFYISQRILELLVMSGARVAEPGEFTRRAFLNGHLDLLQAEAVADLISAKSKQSNLASMQLLCGTISKKIRRIRKELIKTCSLLEIELDFSEEDIEFVPKEQLLRNLEKILGNINSIMETYRYGKILREGANVVIVGRPNVGKSSLLNALAKEDRVIVTDIPGTTRDSIVEDLVINGYLIHLFDTAGIQEPQNVIEKKGIERSIKALKQADIVLFVLDIAEDITPVDSSIFKQCLSIIKSNREKRLIIVLNKIDLGNNSEDKKFGFFVTNRRSIKVSAKTFKGVDLLEKLIIEQLDSISPQSNQQALVITRARHFESLKKAQNHLILAKRSTEQGLSREYISFDVRASIKNLSELIGEVTSMDILNDIFSEFCIGK